MKKPHSAASKRLAKEPDELPRALEALIERLRERDRLRIIAVGSPSPEVEQILRDLGDTVIQDCLGLIGKLLPVDLKKDYARVVAHRARGHKKPSRRNPKLEKWVLKNAGTSTPGEVLARLDSMTDKARKKCIGQESTSLTAIKNILRPAK